MRSPEPTVKFPDAWFTRGSGEERARAALKPFRSLALALGVGEKTTMAGPDLADVGVVVQALVERAEVILGIPDETF